MPKNDNRPTNAQSPFDLAWRAAANLVALAKLRGLTVECPQCGVEGTAFSKWIPKSPTKPLFIVHTNGNGFFKACSLSKEESIAVRSAVDLRRSDAARTLRLGRPFVLFSGGKDSLCLLHYMKTIAAQKDVEITALHADTTAGFPEVEDYVHKVCKKLKVPLVVVRPPHDYFQIAKRWGIPGIRARWCCETLKVAPIRRYLDLIDEPKVVYDGIRAAESNIRATYNPIWYHPAFRCISISPIFGWSDAEADRYIARHRLPKSPAADLGTSSECWCGAYKCRLDFEKLLEVHPEIFDKLVDVERAQRGRYTFVYEEGRRIRLTEVRKKVARRTKRASGE